MPDAQKPARDGEPARQRRVELLATILLAVAAVATAWSTYESTRWRGEQTADYSKATAAGRYSPIMAPWRCLLRRKAK